MIPLTRKLLSELRSRLPPQLPKRLGVAVSGGGDSVALLHLLQQLCRNEDVSLHVATVDHGLRPEAASEAEAVRVMATGLGLSHDILDWQEWDGTGNLQDQARQARYQLLTAWAQQRKIPMIALGHTIDDQAETVLMRLSRAAGVDGLSAMPTTRDWNGVTLLRPLLSVARSDLREYLRGEGVTWLEDPSNQDRRFDRIKARNALEALGHLGITPQTLADVAQNMSRSREALIWTTEQAARDLARIDAGDVLLDLAGLKRLPEEVVRRLLLQALQWIAGAGYAPRRQPIETAMQALRQGKPAQVGGCLILIQGAKARICREFQAVRDLRVPVSDLWDGRWRLTGPETQGAEIGPLGPNGIQRCKNRRETGRHHDALMASPAVWLGSQLVAAPLAGLAAGWHAELCRDEEEFYTSVLSH